MSLADDMADDVATLPDTTVQPVVKKTLAQQMLDDTQTIQSTQAPQLTQGQQQKKNILDYAKQYWNDVTSGNLQKADPRTAIGETALNQGSGLISTAVGGIAGLGRTAYNLATGNSFDKSAELGNQTINAVQQAGTYQPRTAGGKLLSEVVSVPMNAASEMGRSTGGDVGQILGNRAAGEAIGGSIPAVIATLAGGRAALNSVKPTVAAVDPSTINPALTKPDVQVSDVPAYWRKAQADFQAAKASGQPVSAPVTPEGTTPAPVPGEVVAAPSQATGQVAPTSKYTPPTLAETPSTFQQAAQGKALDDVMQRHIEAQSLPVPIQLSEGQAKLDPVKISEEMNGRGKGSPTVSPDFYNAQGKQLGQNLDAMRAKVAPDVVADNPIDHGQTLIDQYKAIDAPKVADINAKYQALRDANGGQFPVDATALYNNMQKSLGNQLLTHDAPAGQLAAIKDMAENGGNMSMEQFLNLRRNLGTTARTATDGNTRMAASTMVDEMEKLPLTGGAANLQPMAQAARAAAKARFDALDSDPAYKAAVNDDVPIGAASPLADKFVDKYIVGGRRADIQTMQKNLSNTDANQTISAATLDALRKSAKADIETGKFNSASYNATVEKLRPKLNDLVDYTTANQVQQLGNVSKYTSAQPAGAYVNNSNTLVGAIAGGAKDLANSAMDIKTFGLSKLIRNQITKNGQQKLATKAIEPAAGTTKISDFP